MQLSMAETAQGWACHINVLVGPGKEGTAVAGLGGALALVIKGKHTQEWPEENGFLGTPFLGKPFSSVGCRGRNYGSLPRLEAFRRRAWTWKGWSGGRGRPEPLGSCTDSLA